MFEIAYSMNRQFGSENWCIYRGKHLYCFLDNHDVSRIATILKNKEHLRPLYALLFTMPGIPAVYYGSEYGWEADKKDGDDGLRVPYKSQENTELTDLISKLAKFHSESYALCYGSYRQAQLQNHNYAFVRETNNETVVSMINAGDAFTFNVNMNGMYEDILTGEKFDLSQGVPVEKNSARVLKKL